MQKRIVTMEEIHAQFEKEMKELEDFQERLEKGQLTKEEQVQLYSIDHPEQVTYEADNEL